MLDQHLEGMGADSRSGGGKLKKSTKKDGCERQIKAKLPGPEGTVETAHAADSAEAGAVKEAPAKEAPAKEALAKEALAKEAPAKEALAKEAPAKEALVAVGSPRRCPYCHREIPENRPCSEERPRLDAPWPGWAGNRSILASLDYTAEDVAAAFKGNPDSQWVITPFEIIERSSFFAPKLVPAPEIGRPASSPEPDTKPQTPSPGESGVASPS